MDNPQPEPVYKFNAVGHMVIDQAVQQAFCSELAGPNADPDEYDTIAACGLNVDPNSEIDPEPLRLTLTDAVGAPVAGKDGLAIRSAGAGA